jgi:hypothetical protein
MRRIMRPEIYPSQARREEADMVFLDIRQTVWVVASGTLCLAERLSILLVAASSPTGICVWLRSPA